MQVKQRGRCWDLKDMTRSSQLCASGICEMKGETMKTVIVNLVKRIFLIVISPCMLIAKIGGPEYGNFAFSEWWHLMKHPEQL